MCVIVLDAAVILLLVQLLHDGEVPSWGTAIGAAIAVSLGFWGCGYLFGSTIGIFAIVPMAALAGGILFATCDLPIKKAMIAGSILLVYRIVLGLIVVAMLKS